jgi:outer membrane protein OmpA-like peptidoglycan-associated protein
VALPPAESGALIAQARDAPLIVLSGRTDGVSDTSAEGRVARQRAEYVRDILVRAGVSAARVRTTWQPIGDHAADNGSPSGRALNRRVEIEVYRVAPRTERLDPGGAA